jgi:hypothetical protein
VNTTHELETDLQPRASSPAQDNQFEGGAQGAEEKRPAQTPAMGAQIVRVGKARKRGEQTSDYGVSADGDQCAQIAKGGASAQGEQAINERVSRTGKKGEQTSVDSNHGVQIAKGGASAQGEQAASLGVSKSCAYPAQIGEQEGEQLLRNSQWLKSILPEASSGWWDIRDKDNRMRIKFRWRDPDLQVMTLLCVMGEQFETLTQSDYEDARDMIREQISLRLRDLSLDPAKREKALIVAAKLGIDLSVLPVHG